MERAVVQVILFGLLLAFAAALPNKDDWDIYSFHINSTVASRYATTVITSRVANRMNESKEIEFHVQIPKNAFISKFKMLIDGEVYDGVVKAKEQAQQQYTEAVIRGQSAGIVSSVGRTLEEFKTSVNIAAHKKVTFELTYEELMKRTHGKYELQIHARPMQPVKDFKVDVHIHEKAGISFVDVKGGLSTKALANAITKTKADEQAWVHFYPTVDQQKVCDSCGEHGLNGDLIVVYDVSRDSGLGEIKTSDGYFIHHFAPASLPRISKNVVFVIDRSGSMHGTKMEQTRRALIHILNDLAEEDFFGLITFDYEIFHWKKELVQATSENLQKAKTFAETIEARGSTNINTAVLKGAEMLNAHPREDSASILILLTDGDPTSGVTNIESIQSNVRRAIAGKFPLYCLGFGFDVNFEFLEKMSLQNNGVGRRIYEDSDADLQLRGFYEEVATPLLTDVTMIYLGGTNLTQTNFSQYYNGSEIVVAGQITDNNIETFIPQVVAVSRNGTMTFSNTKTSTVTPTGTVSEGLLQRVWAYLTVKQFLEKELLLSGAEKEKVKKEALELSLKYSFVTPHTSMVVTKPQGENTDVLHKPKEGERSSQHRQYPTGHGQPMKTPTSSGGHWSTVPDQSHYGVGGYPSYPSYSGLFGPRGGPGPPGYPGISGLLPSSPHANAQAPVSQRFVLKTENQSPLLCFDIHGEVLLKLLHDPSKELYVNGELDSVKDGGFKKIVIHVQTDLLVKVDTNEVTVQEGQAAARTVGEDPVTVGSLTVINRGNEIDIAVGDVRIVILIHGNNNKFLWPVLRQRPSADNTEGILETEPLDKSLTLDAPFWCTPSLDRNLLLSPLNKESRPDLLTFSAPATRGGPTVRPSKQTAQSFPAVAPTLQTQLTAQPSQEQHQFPPSAVPLQLFSADQPVSHLSPPDTSASFTQSLSGAPPQLLPLQISTQFPSPYPVVQTGSHMPPKFSTAARLPCLAPTTHLYPLGSISPIHAAQQMASSWIAPGSETPTLPPSWPDSPGSTLSCSVQSLVLSSFF